MDVILLLLVLDCKFNWPVIVKFEFHLFFRAFYSLPYDACVLLVALGLPVAVFYICFRMSVSKTIIHLPLSTQNTFNNPKMSSGTNFQHINWTITLLLKSF